MCIEELAGSYDRDIIEGAQGEQVLVAGDDEVGVACDGTFEDAVIVGVAGNGIKGQVWNHQFGNLQKAMNDSSYGGRWLLKTSEQLSLDLFKYR